MLVVSIAALAAPPAGWTEQLGETWVLTEGWPASRLELRPPAPELPADDWIGLVFRADGTVGWTPVRHVDRSGGCSNAFTGFRGSWEVRAGRVTVQLVEQTGAREYPSAMVVEALRPDLLILAPAQ